jgi:hypothetical protein
MSRIFLTRFFISVETENLFHDSHMQEKQTTAQYSCTTTMTAIYSNSFLYSYFGIKKNNLLHHKSGNCHSWSQRFHPAQKRECSKNLTCESHLGAEKGGHPQTFPSGQ